ncbi:pyruvate kinase [Aerococcus urinaeequi]|uniref:pyruvate kinase n=1 Tax=Aerococcus urinaeequi TaxID=51665 RepID=UPI0007410EB3
MTKYETHVNNIYKDLYEEVRTLRENVYKDGQQIFESWNPDTLRDDFKEAALNFAYYVALRRRDIRELQLALGNLGLSSLGRLEGHVLATLDLVLYHLAKSADIEPAEIPEHLTKTSQGHGSTLDQLTNDFFGPGAKDRYSRIMVTMPNEAATDQELVDEMVASGMDVARINCAHDDEETWRKMVENIQQAGEKHDREIKIFTDIAGPKVRIQAIYTSLQNPRLYEGDVFFLTSETTLRDFYDCEIVLSCPIPEIIEDLKVDEGVSLDDGKILGQVQKVYPEGVKVKITQMASNGKKVKATKGINFPDRELNIPVLTDKDIDDLAFSKEAADVIGFSFVHDLDDVRHINQAMAEKVTEDQDKLATIKLETVSGFENLINIIIEANRYRPTGIMIARGDLAVEVGYLRLSVVQEEILWFCEAAQIPVIWATQVLESLVKSGVPSRAEISDVSMGARAECVMLNKGEHILEGINLLRSILEDIDEHQFKKTALMKQLNVAKTIFE